MSGNHDVYVVRINDPKSYRSKADLRFTKHNIIEQIGENQSIDTGGNSQLQAVQKHVDRVGI